MLDTAYLDLPASASDRPYMVYGKRVNAGQMLGVATSMVLWISLACTTACAREAQQPALLTGELHPYGRTEGGRTLRGVLYRPAGKGPFPVIVYAHGSAPGFNNNEAFEAIAPAFTSRGWAFFAPYRRGQGLSAEAGPYIKEQIAAARRSRGAAEAQVELARVLSEEQMRDQEQAVTWVSAQPFADASRVAVMGNSFGGIIALLSAQRLEICAAIDAAGGAESWQDAPSLRSLMTSAATAARAPVLFFQASNDHDVTPTHTLHGAMIQAGKESQMKLYPAFGANARDGHAFPYRGVSLWRDDAHAFLTRSCPQSGNQR